MGICIVWIGLHRMGGITGILTKPYILKETFVCETSWKKIRTHTHKKGCKKNKLNPSQ